MPKMLSEEEIEARIQRDAKKSMIFKERHSWGVCCELLKKYPQTVPTIKEEIKRAIREIEGLGAVPDVNEDSGAEAVVPVVKTPEPADFVLLPQYDKPESVLAAHFCALLTLADPVLFSPFILKALQKKRCPSTRQGGAIANAGILLWSIAVNAHPLLVAPAPRPRGPLADPPRVGGHGLDPGGFADLHRHAGTLRGGAAAGERRAGDRQALFADGRPPHRQEDLREVRCAAELEPRFSTGGRSWAHGVRDFAGPVVLEHCGHGDPSRRAGRARLRPFGAADEKQARCGDNPSADGAFRIGGW